MKKIIEYLKENLCTICILLILVTPIILMGIAVGIGVHDYNSLTTEQRQQVYESRVERYEIASVCRYVRTTTNSLGGIINTEIRYSFAYIKDGKTYWEDIGFNDVVVGKRDLYVINNNSHGERTLYLTQETLNNIDDVN